MCPRFGFGNTGARDNNIPGGFVRSVVDHMAHETYPRELDGNHEEQDDEGNDNRKLNGRGGNSPRASIRRFTTAFDRHVVRHCFQLLSK
ncbi:MAG: hypothetical protein ACI9HK_002190 [Pirellulaceae bacterium]